MNPSEMTVNIHRDVIKGDVTSASEDDRFIGYDLRNDTSKNVMASKQEYRKTTQRLKSAAHLVITTSKYFDKRLCEH